MAHHTLKSGYAELTERLNKFPQGAPPSELLERILGLLFTEEEARLVAKLPVVPFRAPAAGRAWHTTTGEAQRILDELAAKTLIVDAGPDDDRLYFLPPPIAGFFEFSMMRLGDGGPADDDLAALFHQYLTVEDSFVQALYSPGETQYGRILVHEPALPSDDALRVLEHDLASAVIEDAYDIAVGLCSCRHRMAHIGRACDAPAELCMALNSAAGVIVRSGLGRRIDAAEALAMVAQAREHGLVQFAENVRERVNFICNCCSCCCDTLRAARDFAHLQPVHTTRFLPIVDQVTCRACGRCAAACPVGSIEIAPPDPSGGNGHGGGGGDHGGGNGSRGADLAVSSAAIDTTTCLGCGVCVGACPHGAISLSARAERIITPLDSAHRCVVMAIERGKLQNLVFAQQSRGSHRAMAAILGVVLRLPPLKQALASEQMKSRFMEALVRRANPWP